MDVEDDYRIADLDDRLDRVEADLGELKQVLRNLLRPRSVEAGSGLAYSHLRQVTNDVGR